MELRTKIEKSKSCVHESHGKCSLDGYPPFDCELCTSYMIKVGTQYKTLKSGDLVKIISKKSHYYGAIATYLGFCNGRWGKEYIRVRVSDKRIINLRYDSVERYWR